MGEALRHVERAHVVGIELDGDVLEVGWALRPQIDDDVEDGAARAAHDLGLGRRRVLEVHAAERALPSDSMAMLAWTMTGFRPRCPNSRWQKVRAKKPRSSSRRSRSMMNAPLSLVSVKITSRDRLASARQRRRWRA